ncbi:hypothetical protein ACFX13_019367 [Malus domestica]
MPKSFNDLNNVLSHSIPVVLIKASREPIKSRGPRRRYLRDSQYYFCGSYRGSQYVVVLRCDPGFHVSHNIINLTRSRRLKQFSKIGNSRFIYLLVLLVPLPVGIFNPPDKIKPSSFQHLRMKELGVLIVLFKPLISRLNFPVDPFILVGSSEISLFLLKRLRGEFLRLKSHSDLSFQVFNLLF